MLIAVFKSNQRITNVLTLILAAVFWVVAFYTTEEGFYFSKWIDGLLSVGLITIQAIWLNRIVNQNKLIERSSYLTSLILVILNSMVFFSTSFNWALVANLFIVGAFNELLKLYQLKNKASFLFNASLLVGIASIFYYPYIVYFIFVWVVLIYFTTPNWRDFMISLLGVLVPILYLATYYFVFKDISQLIWKVEQKVTLELSEATLNFKTLFVFCIGVVIASLYVLLQIMSKSVVRVKKMLSATIIMCLFSVAIYLINEQNFIDTIISVSVPLAIIVAAFFDRLKKAWLAELIFAMLLANIVWIYFS